MIYEDINDVLNSVHSTNAAISIFLANPSDSNAESLNEGLKNLTEYSRSIMPAGFIPTSDSRIGAFVLNAQALMGNPATRAITRSRLCLLLYNLCSWNIHLRRKLSSVDQMCASVRMCLQRSIDEQLGPQNLIDILRLLQLLTYERCFVVGTWTFDLLKFLNNEILKEPDVEWLPYCMAILCNLLGRSKTVCNEFKQKYYRKRLPRRCMDLLAHDSRLVVVCTLLIIGRLDTTVTAKVFSKDNVSQTIMCGFNVLSVPDHILTVQYAVDFLKSILINDTEPIPQLNEISRQYPTFEYFEASICTLSSLLVVLDARSEECFKVYDLLLSLCKIPELVQPICSVILKAPAPSQRCNTLPKQAVVRTALILNEESPVPEVPIQALKLLNYLVKEAINDAELTDYFEDPDILIAVVDANVKTQIETVSDMVVYQCQRISEGLKLAQSLADDKTANEKLRTVLSTSLCAHISETQLVSNTAVVQLCSSGSPKEVPEWSKHAISIPIELIKFLRILKDHSRMHKDLYWRMLEEDRLLPFLSTALIRGNSEQVYGALKLISQCEQNQRFPWMTLVGHMLNCSRSLLISSSSSPSSSQPTTSNGHNGHSSMEH